MKEFPVRSPAEKVGGVVYFGRMLDKIRLQAATLLPFDFQANLAVIKTADRMMKKALDILA